MSGHSKWSTIKRTKGANDAKRGAVFTKIGNQIAIAARSGTDPAINPSLALAIEKAKAANMPGSNIDRAIQRVADKSVAQLEEIVYEAYGQGGTAIIIEAATDNRNRTFPDIRSVLTKNGGNIAEPGSVMFNFDHKGVIRVAATGEDALLAVLDAGASDAIEEDGELVVYTEDKKLNEVRQNIVNAGLTVKDFGLEYVAKNQVPINDESVQEKLLKLLDALDELDDVVAVHTNADF